MVWLQRKGLSFSPWTSSHCALRLLCELVKLRDSCWRWNQVTALESPLSPISGPIWGRLMTKPRCQPQHWSKQWKNYWMQSMKLPSWAPGAARLFTAARKLDRYDFVRIHGEATQDNGPNWIRAKCVRGWSVQGKSRWQARWGPCSALIAEEMPVHSILSHEEIKSCSFQSQDVDALYCHFLSLPPCVRIG